jgi:hypothetical protein
MAQNQNQDPKSTDKNPVKPENQMSDSMNATEKQPNEKNLQTTQQDVRNTSTNEDRDMDTSDDIERETHGKERTGEENKRKGGL